MNAPSVMVSSTFYDLSQIHSDLLDFLQDEVGYRPLLSEYPSFPVDPDVDTIENYRRRVEEDADILVLVVGGRYGYVDSATDKSVTNLEYLAARAQGISIYVFVDKRVAVVLRVWRSNPDGNFSAAVDDVRLFEFVEQVRSADRVWTHEFERAQDIIAVLRIQFAHLMLQGLRWQMKLRRQPQAALRGLHGEALRLALEQPKAWEYLLFGQVLCDDRPSTRTGHNGCVPLRGDRCPCSFPIELIPQLAHLGGVGFYFLLSLSGFALTCCTGITTYRFLTKLRAKVYGIPAECGTAYKETVSEERSEFEKRDRKT